MLRLRPVPFSPALEDLYLPNGAYRYSRGWNWKAVAATLVGCALAWGGLVFPPLKPLYDYAWFVGFFASGLLYWALSSRSLARDLPSAPASGSPRPARPLA